MSTVFKMFSIMICVLALSFSAFAGDAKRGQNKRGRAPANAQQEQMHSKGGAKSRAEARKNRADAKAERKHKKAEKRKAHADKKSARKQIQEEPTQDTQDMINDADGDMDSDPSMDSGDDTL